MAGYKGKQGRKRKPTKLKVLQGTFRKDRENPKEPKVPTEIPDCPEFLTTDAKKEWKRIIEVVEGTGIITKLDRSILAMYCQAWADYIEARAEWNKGPKIFRYPSGYEGPSPWFSIMNRASERVMKTAVELGFTPASRSRIVANPPGDDSNDPWDNF